MTSEEKLRINALKYAVKLYQTANGVPSSENVLKMAEIFLKFLKQK